MLWEGDKSVGRKTKAENSQLSPSTADPYGRPAPVFVGFEEGQAARIGALYEFNTASGDYVYLHEMDCVDMHYRPFSRQFVLTFECVSSDLMPESVAVLMFDDAEIYSWETNVEGSQATSDESRARGQVSGFDCMVSGPQPSDLAGVSFHLSLSDVRIDFFASTVTCEVRPGRWKPVGLP